MQFLRQLQSRLSSELDNNAFGFFMLNNIPQMFPENRFEIKFIGNVKVG